MAMKTLFYNFSAQDLHQFLRKVYLGGVDCFYFSPHFSQKFVSGSILCQSIIYEENKEICCCCFICRDEIQLRTNFIDEIHGYFYELKKFLIQHYHVLDKSSLLYTPWEIS